jgi:DNA-binding NtrC family response regulator
MQKLLAQARRVASSQAPVLFLGETGSGKEVLARALHQASTRAQGPFIAINCAAIPAELLESELFGHAKGAFTGAVTDKPGRIQAAEGGTLFLDEIGDLPLALQPKLLRVLQEKTIEPVGKNQSIPVDFRLICATHHDLRARVAAGQFREDLYYRLNVLPLQIPPLRERRADIPALFLRLCQKACELEGRVAIDVEPALLDRLAQMDWPGNVRELENAAKRLVALCSDTVLKVEALMNAGLEAEEDSDGRVVPSIGHPMGHRISLSMGAESPLPEGHLDLEAWIDDLVLRALEKHEGNQSATARYLGVSRNTLVYRLEKRGLRS